MIFLGIDVGGTFTDVIAFDSKLHSLHVNKVLTNSRKIENGVLEALGRYEDSLSEVHFISHATTIATNALLTHSGLAHTALITNQGFRDVLEIGRQRRPELYDLEVKRPMPLVPRKDRFTINGRILSDGRELHPLSKSQLKKITKRILAENYEAVVVAFLNSYINPKHELEASEILRGASYRGHIEISSGVNREYREYERFSTAVVNACLAPLVSSYLSNLSSHLRGGKYHGPIYVMNSDGSAATIRNASKHPVQMIESGPAAGVLASKHLAETLRLPNVLTFDMGGTTAKAGAIVNYQPDISYEFEAAGLTHSGRSIKGSGYPVRSPFIDLAEVSAGGGTIAWIDDAGALKVGPGSAGSDPGPSAYGRGGQEPTVTDANIVLGRINPDSLLGGAMRLNKVLAYNSLNEKIARKIGLSVEESAQGIIKLVNNMMARAISIVSVERGRDPRDYSLVAFGGAGPIHACDLAEEIEISRIVIPEHAGLFSARGLLTADLERNFSLPVMKDASEVSPEYFFSKLRSLARKTLREENQARRFLKFRTIESISARYLGQSYELLIPYRKGETTGSIQRRFNVTHRKLYGYSSEDRIEIVAAKLRAIILSIKPKIEIKTKKILEPTDSLSDFKKHGSLRTGRTRRSWISGRYCAVPVYNRDTLAIGIEDKGPCIIEEYDSTAVINSSWSWKTDRHRNLIVTRE
jgi:N-methylhydantoinase A